MFFPPPKSTGLPHRVVITGAGIVTALGIGWSRNAEGFRAGRTAFKPVSLFDVSRQRVKNAAQVDLPSTLPATRLSTHRMQRLSRGARLLLTAAHEAWVQSGWEAVEDLPVVLGTTSGGMALGQEFYSQAIHRPPSKRGQPSRVLNYQSQRPGLDLGDAFGFTGPVTIIANACASGGNAIGHAFELVRDGYSERVLTGGYDELSHLVFSGFDSLQALSPTCCRPFDAHRDGLSLGEGAAVLTLETLASARQRNAEILGEIIGYGATTDTHHLTQPHPEGDAAFAAMQAACASAGISPAEVNYVNAHGTGTPLNDRAEASALNRWAGPHAPSLAVSSTKASIGHLLGAAGAVEAVVCLMALREQWLPPEMTVETPDPLCQFQIVREPKETPIRIALSNSFGFGGANASLLLRRWV